MTAFITSTGGKFAILNSFLKYPENYAMKIFKVLKYQAGIFYKLKLNFTLIYF